VVLKNIKKHKRQKSEKLQLSQERSKLLFCSDNEAQWRYFAEPVRKQKIEKHAVTDLDLRNDENRPSLSTGGAPVAERQEVSSKNTIDKMADATTIYQTMPE